MEFVYVVERARLFDGSFPHGFAAASERPDAAKRQLARIRAHGFFVERRAAESNPYWKQVIPYVVVRRGESILLLERKGRQGEARLHGKLSVGVGGHINPIDGPVTGSGDVLLQGLRRELDEELFVRGPLEVRAAGFLNDDSTEVGAVHYGLVAVADAARAEVSIRETEMMDGRFVGRRELLELHASQRDRFETWSSLLLDRLDAVLAAEVPLEEALAETA